MSVFASVFENNISKKDAKKAEMQKKMQKKQAGVLRVFLVYDINFISKLGPSLQISVINIVVKSQINGNQSSSLNN